MLCVTGKPIFERFLRFFILSLQKYTSPLVSFLLNFELELFLCLGLFLHHPGPAKAVPKASSVHLQNQKQD